MPDWAWTPSGKSALVKGETYLLDFATSNEIRVLAEGVETEKELAGKT